MNKGSDSARRHVNAGFSKKEEVPGSKSEMSGKGKTVQYLDQPPDDGWGWMVVLSSFLVHAFVIGSIKSFGVFYAVFRETFDEGAGDTAFINSTLVGVMLICSPITSALSRLTSCRVMVFTGGVLASVGLIVSSFATGVMYLLVSLGLFTGFAMSLMYSPCLVMVGRYFDKRRATANGIGLSGNGVGMFALSPLYQVLIDEFSYRGALLIIAGITLHGCICGALLRPIHLREDQDHKAKVDRKHQNTIDNSASSCRKCTTTASKLLHIFDLSLLTDVPFALFFFSHFGTVLGYSIVFVHMVDHARSIGVGKTEASFLISVMGITEFIFRLIAGWFADVGVISRLHVYMIGVAGVGVCNLFVPLCTSYASLVTYMAFYGLFSGVFHSLIAVLVREYTGVARLSNGIGWTFLGSGAAYLLGAPIAGWLYDATGNYNVSFYSAGAMILVSLAVLFLEKCVKHDNLDLETADNDTTSQRISRDTTETMVAEPILKEWETTV